ncbi:CAD protein [Bienertia sinuspersici]
MLRISKEEFCKENGYGETKKGPPDKTVVKSLSSTGGASIPMDVSNAQSSVSTAKGPRFGSAKNSNEKIYTVANKTNQVLSVGGSSPMKVSSSRTTMGSKIFKVATSSKRVIEGRKGIQADGNANGKGCGTLAPEDKDVANQLAVGSVEERKSPCNVRYVINSSARNVNANCDQGLNLSTQNSKVDNIALDKNDHSVASYEILPFDYKHMKVLPTLDREDIDHMVPLTISAVPESRCIWKGTFKLEKSGELPTDCYGVQAHLSTRASSKVAELVHGFSPEMLLKEVPRSHTWPVQFQKNHPTEQDIALYFFAQDLWSYGRSYRMLLDIMTNSDLALEGSFGGWNTLPFLWGVFRARKVDGCTLSPHSLNTETLNQGLNSTVTFGSEGKFVPTPVGGSAFVSRTSHNSMQGPESAGPEVLQSPALVESEDQVIEYEEPSLEKHIVNLQKHHVQADSATFTHAWRKEDSGWSIHNDDLQKGNRVSDEDMKSTNKVDVVQHDQTTREQTSSFGFCYDGNYEIPGLIRFNDSASEPWQRHDVASGISFSLDSGPSGSSDGGGSAKSADESQVEPSRSYDDLNLNLCLGNGSDSEAKIDLDLVLGIPTQSKYKRKHFLKDGSYQDGNVSLVLSLGMPCSTSSAV